MAVNHRVGGSSPSAGAIESPRKGAFLLGNLSFAQHNTVERLVYLPPIGGGLVAVAARWCLETTTACTIVARQGLPTYGLGWACVQRRNRELDFVHPPLHHVVAARQVAQLCNRTLAMAKGLANDRIWSADLL